MTPIESNRLKLFYSAAMYVWVCLRHRIKDCRECEREYELLERADEPPEVKP